jgi:hypothetical protein
VVAVEVEARVLIVKILLIFISAATAALVEGMVVQEETAASNILLTEQ